MWTRCKLGLQKYLHIRVSNTRVELKCKLVGNKVRGISVYKIFKRILRIITFIVKTIRKHLLIQTSTYDEKYMIKIKQRMI